MAYKVTKHLTPAVVPRRSSAGVGSLPCTRCSMDTGVRLRGGAGSTTGSVAKGLLFAGLLGLVGAWAGWWLLRKDRRRR